MSGIGAVVKFLAYAVAIVVVIALGGVYGGRMIGILGVMLSVAALIITLDVRKIRSSRNISVLRAVDMAIGDLITVWFKGKKSNEKRALKTSKRKGSKRT